MDVDDDLWTDLTWDGQYQDEDTPKWLYDPPMKQGIRAMLELEHCEEELERLNHECSMMHAWLRGQRELLQLASRMAKGTLSVVFFY